MDRSAWVVDVHMGSRARPRGSAALLVVKEKDPERSPYLAVSCSHNMGMMTTMKFEIMNSFGRKYRSVHVVSAWELPIGKD